ncbi:hypothetical protein, partial [Brochothrix thermosphacta]|uniref:hypothetical protein n=1 Tax=Brochothrix thermosphacta TaxID=2756 RepID=UPI001C7D6771
LEIVKTADGTTQKASTSFQVKNNNTYIISFDVKITGTMPTTNISLFAIRGFKDKNTSNSAANATKNVYVGKNDVSNLKLDYWHRVSIKFDTNADYLRIIPYNSDTTNTLNTQYRRIQVEEGNIATDWTESSSDVDKAVLLVD